jgi:hypothetical protein
MVHRMRTVNIGLIGGMTLALASAAMAGGFGLSARRSTDHPKVKGGVLLVQAEGCYGPGATVSATAEGLVNGRRRSIPLRLTKVGTDSAGTVTYTLRRQWPAEGVWVLSLTGVNRLPSPNGKGEAITCRAMLELGPHNTLPAARDGAEKYLPLRYVSNEKKEIQIALQTIANKGKQNASITRSAR